MLIERIISGGQSGADQAGLRAAHAAGIPTGGWAPKGWLTEDGPAPWLADFGLKEFRTSYYPDRTYANVDLADAALWFGTPYSAGGRLTLNLCSRRGVWHFIVVTGVIHGSQPVDASEWIRDWVGPDLKTLMIAGNRESKSPGIGVWVEDYLGEVFRLLREGS